MRAREACGTGRTSDGLCRCELCCPCGPITALSADPSCYLSNAGGAGQSPSINTAEIELKEVSEVDLDGDGEEEIDYEASDLEYDDDEDDEDEELSPYAAPAVEYQYSPRPIVPRPGAVPRAPAEAVLRRASRHTPRGDLRT